MARHFRKAFAVAPVQLASHLDAILTGPVWPVRLPAAILDNEWRRLHNLFFLRGRFHH
jgi:hypothetical protein